LKKNSSAVGAAQEFFVRASLLFVQQTNSGLLEQLRAGLRRKECIFFACPRSDFAALDSLCSPRAKR
jgi:hypothetical protein